VTIEEHGRGRQLLRYRIWPRWSRGELALIAALAGLVVLAVESGASPGVLVLILAAALLVFRLFVESTASVALLVDAVREPCADAASPSPAPVQLLPPVSELAPVEADE
jgi:hypothetical protein